LSNHLTPLLGVCLTASGLACEKKQEATPPAAEVVVAPVEKRDVSIYQEWVGTTTGFVNAKIYPKVEGYLLKQAYRDGSLVKAGELLFEIDPREYKAALDEARGQLGRAKAALGKAEQDVTRYTPLAAQGAVSQQELDDAIQARAAARAQVNSAEAAVENARLNLEWTQVKSPIDGIAGIANAQIGDLVRPITLLTSVSQLDPIKVNVQVSEIDYLRFAKRAKELEETGHSPTELELILANGERYPERGRVSAAGLAVTTTTGTLELQCIFPNPNNLLRPGQFARVRAVTDHLRGALVIPQRAVRDLQGLHQVAVVAADDKVTFKNVKLGSATGSDYVVASGLQAQDRVVVEGLQKIRDGMLVKPVPMGDVASGSPPQKPSPPEKDASAGDAK
jgi:RND family efflux transporter MFP subunit